MSRLTMVFAMLFATQVGQVAQGAKPAAQATPSAVDSVTAIVKDLQSRMRPEDVALWNRVNDVIVANRVVSLLKDRGPSPGEILTTVVTLLIASGGWVFAWLQYRRQLYEAKARESERKEGQTERISERMANQKEAERRRLLDALEWFSGKTQRRAIGIGIVSANWDAWEELRDTWVAVLVNQAAYLLTGSEQAESVAEHANLERVMWLLQDDPKRINQLGKWQLGDALGKALRSGDAKKSATGVHVKKETLLKWWKGLLPEEDVPAMDGQDTGKVADEVA